MTEFDPNAAVTAGEDDDLDFGAIPDNKDRFIHPDGDYEFVCLGFERDISGNGNKQLIWDFRGPEELRNLTFKVWTVLTPNALWKLQEVTSAMGITPESNPECFKVEEGEDGKVKKKLQIEPLKAVVKGRRIMGQLRVESNNGKRRSVIKKCSAHPDGAGSDSAEPAF